ERRRLASAGESRRPAVPRVVEALDALLPDRLGDGEVGFVAEDVGGLDEQLGVAGGAVAEREHRRRREARQRSVRAAERGGDVFVNVFAAVERVGAKAAQADAGRAVTP